MTQRFPCLSNVQPSSASNIVLPIVARGVGFETVPRFLSCAGVNSNTRELPKVLTHRFFVLSKATPSGSSRAALSSTIGEGVPLLVRSLGVSSTTLLFPVSAIHRLAAGLHHAGDDAPHATASSAIAGIERNENAADLLEVRLNALNVCIVASVLSVQRDWVRRKRLVLREKFAPRQDSAYRLTVGQPMSNAGRLTQTVRRRV